MKKVLSLVLIGILSLTLCLALVACGGSSEQKIMSLSCNPSVEFMLDESDKVISVTATNEEGNLILQAYADENGSLFIGKSADAAAKIFVEKSDELGFIVSGDVEAEGGKISVAFSGNTAKAEKLFEEVKAEINSYLTAENITVAINQADAIVEEHLEALVAKVSPYLTEAEIRAMDYKALVNELHKANQETAAMYSEQLKNAYYQAKADAFELAKLETLKNHLGTAEKIAVEITIGLYSTAIETLEALRKELLVDEDSAYQQALAGFRTAKAEYLNYRTQVLEAANGSALEATVTAELARLDAAVEQTEVALEAAGVAANEGIDTAKARAKALLDQALAEIEDASVRASDFATEISAKQTEKLTALTTRFEADYAAAITAAKNNWAAMQAELTASAQ